MKRSPKKIIELCVYIALIIVVIVWTLTTGKKITPFETIPILITKLIA